MFLSTSFSVLLLVFLALTNLTTQTCLQVHPHPHPHHPHHRPNENLKRTAQTDSLNEIDITSGPSPITIDLPSAFLPPSSPAAEIQILPPAAFLPPPWSPTSDTESPYPVDGVTPLDDSGGRSQMIDNEPASVWKWGRCPAKRVDCSRCPGDKRCQRAVGPFTLTNSSTDTGPSLISSGGGSDDADTEKGSTTNPSSSTASSSSPLPTTPETTGNESCALQKCSSRNAFLQCGVNAQCTRGYCVCKLGYKGSSQYGTGHRGTEDLGALTVYQNPGVDCDVQCDELGCREVKALEKGTCWSSDGGVDEDEDEGMWTGKSGNTGVVGPGELDTDGVRSGSIKLPSAEEILGLDGDGGSGDYVAGVADVGGVNEAT